MVRELHTQAAHAVGVSKRTGGSGVMAGLVQEWRCEQPASLRRALVPNLYMKCQPHRVDKRFLSLRNAMLTSSDGASRGSRSNIIPPVGALKALDFNERELRQTVIHVLRLHRSHASRQSASNAPRRANAPIACGPSSGTGFELRWSPERICAYLHLHFPT